LDRCIPQTIGRLSLGLDAVLADAIRKPQRRDGLFQKNGWWWIDYYDADGKRHRKKAAPDYNTAKTIYRDTMTKIAKGEVLGVREEGIRLRDFVDKRYWPAAKPTLAPAWAERSRGILDQQILPTFGDSRLSGIRQEAIERWYAGRRAAVKASTANKELARLKHLLARAVSWGYLKASPAAKVTKAKETGGRVRYLTAEERQLLLEGGVATVKAKDGRAWTIEHKPSPALRLYVLAALMTGARRGELLRLRWSEVDMKRRSLTFRETKNGHDRTVPMTPALAEAFQALPRPLDATSRVLPVYEDPHVLTRAFARHAKRVGVQGVTFRDLRHDAASTLTMAGVPQRAVMELLGHRDPRMTVRYQHLAPGHLRDAMRALDRALEPPVAPTAALAAEVR
jgi:integrase